MMDNDLNLPSKEETEASVQIFKAFGNETRYKILYLLFEKQLTVNEISDRHDTISGLASTKDLAPNRVSL